MANNADSTAPMAVLHANCDVGLMDVSDRKEWSAANGMSVDPPVMRPMIPALVDSMRWAKVNFEAGVSVVLLSVLVPTSSSSSSPSSPLSLLLLLLPPLLLGLLKKSSLVCEAAEGVMISAEFGRDDRLNESVFSVG